MAELDPLISSYSHLADFPRAKDALHALKKIASLVKPIMRARGWKVRQITEFYPSEQNLLGLNVNRGQKICLRLRYASDRNQFLPIEQVTDTMLHELSHNVHGPHDAKFHVLWNQLRDEYEGLVMKGYTGEGFLSEGKRLGGRGVPMLEARRLARAAAEKRRTLATRSGQRLGGFAPRLGQDIRRVIVDAVERRNRALRGCANDTHNEDELREIAETATRNGFKTQADEDAANEAAIAQALWELVQEDEKAKYGDSYVLPTAGNPSGNGEGAVPVTASGRKDTNVQPPKPRPHGTLGGDVAKQSVSVSIPTSWTCQICTLENPLNYLCCDACGIERAEETPRDLTESLAKRQRAETAIDLTSNRPTAARTDFATGRPDGAKTARPSHATTKLPKPKTWTCSFCGQIRDWNFWSCDICDRIKDSS
ncbi:WLM domain-containing protein [Xylariales sp. AK1849]|nr:WLM domain-containing protein [Xylariales sp. AK1849]